MCRAHPHLMLPLTTSATNRDRHTNRQSWKKGPLFSLTLPLTDTLFCLKERVKVWQQKRKPFDVWSCLSSIQDLMTFDFHEVGRDNLMSTWNRRNSWLTLPCLKVWGSLGQPPWHESTQQSLTMFLALAELLPHQQNAFTTLLYRPFADAVVFLYSHFIDWIERLLLQ